MPNGAGPRAVPGSQRVGPCQAEEVGDSTVVSHAWSLRAGDGSRSGGSVEKHPIGFDSGVRGDDATAQLSQAS